MQINLNSDFHIQFLPLTRKSNAFLDKANGSLGLIWLKFRQSNKEKTDLRNVLHQFNLITIFS